MMGQWVVAPMGPPPTSFASRPLMTPQRGMPAGGARPQISQPAQAARNRPGMSQGGSKSTGKGANIATARNSAKGGNRAPPPVTAAGATAAATAGKSPSSGMKTLIALTVGSTAFATLAGPYIAYLFQKKMVKDQTAQAQQQMAGMGYPPTGGAVDAYGNPIPPPMDVGVTDPNVVSPLPPNGNPGLNAAQLQQILANQGGSPSSPLDSGNGMGTLPPQQAALMQQMLSAAEQDPAWAAQMDQILGQSNFQTASVKDSKPIGMQKDDFMRQTLNGATPNVNGVIGAPPTNSLGAGLSPEVLQMLQANPALLNQVLGMGNAQN